MNKNRFNELKFSDMKVYTRTLIGVSNVLFSPNEIFEILPITSYSYVEKKRGRKKKNVKNLENKILSDGCIIYTKYGNKSKGVTTKKKKGFFRNSLTIVMFIHEKKINMKLSKTGKLQITGCKTKQQAIDGIFYLWKYIKNFTNIYSFKTKTNVFELIIIPTMCNIDFSLNFLVDREELDQYFNENTIYHSLLETDFGHTGVNIKMPFSEDIEKLKLTKVRLEDDKQIITNIIYKEYLNTLSETQKKKKLLQKRYNTFLVFHSGNVIMSGIDLSFMENTFNTFINIIKSSYNTVREQLISK